MKRIAARLMAWGAGLVLLGAAAAPAAAQVPVTACGTLGGNTSYILTADLLQDTSGAPCLVIAGNGTTINMNGHSISGLNGNNTDGAGIEGSSINAFTGLSANANNVTIVGPGIIHDFGFCVRLGMHALVKDLLVHDCQPSVAIAPFGAFIGLGGITLGPHSKCEQCRVHDVRISEPAGRAWGIYMGYGCLLESSIVELSDNGAWVGSDCKVWDLVVDGAVHIGVYAQAGTEVARTVVSHCNDGPSIQYDCGVGFSGYGTTHACQDSSNSAWCPSPGLGITISSGNVVTDCATNNNGTKFLGNTAQCT